MELFLEIQNSKASASSLSPRKTFTRAGGVIGRAEGCDWVIVDGKRHVSNRHARISYYDGRFFITDISSNGVFDHTRGRRLPKHEAVPIEHNGTYVLGDFQVRAQWSAPPPVPDAGVARPAMATELTSDDAVPIAPSLLPSRQAGFGHFGADQIRASGAVDDFVQCADYARIDTEHLLVPTLIPTSTESATQPCRGEPPSDGFWDQFGEALGVDLHELDQHARQALALKAARLLKQCVGGVQQSLYTRNELKNELRLARTGAQAVQRNPLKYTAHAGEALSILLHPEKPEQWPASRAVATAFRELQAHQIALLAASRAAIRSTLEHFAPAQLTLRFERDHRTWMTTSGSCWRAFGRYHHALCQDDEWSERLLARDFAQAYEEQVRLIATLHTDLQG